MAARADETLLTIYDFYAVAGGDLSPFTLSQNGYYMLVADAGIADATRLTTQEVGQIFVVVNLEEGDKNSVESKARRRCATTTTRAAPRAQFPPRGSSAIARARRGVARLVFGPRGAASAASRAFPS